MNTPQQQTKDEFHNFLDWLVDLTDFDPNQGKGIFDAPGAISVNQGREVVELPWALSCYQGETKVLDIGSVYQAPWFHEALAHLGVQELTGIDPKPGSQDGLWLQRGGTVPLEGEQFPLISCLSHLAMFSRFQGEVWALNEFYRLLLPGGRLLLSVALGPGYYSQRQWLNILTRSPFDISSLRYFYYNEGWLECYPDLACQTPFCGEPKGISCALLAKAK